MAIFFFISKYLPVLSIKIIVRMSHQSQTFYRNWFKMFTNHRPPRSERLGLNITDTQGYQECQCLESDGHYASPAIVTRNHCSRSRCCSWCWVTLLPRVSWSPPVPRSAPLGSMRRSPLTWSVTELKTKQFRGELYRYNIHTETLIHLVEISWDYISLMYY